MKNKLSKSRMPAFLFLGFHITSTHSTLICMKQTRTIIKNSIYLSEQRLLTLFIVRKILKSNIIRGIDTYNTLINVNCFFFGFCFLTTILQSF